MNEANEEQEELVEVPSSQELPESQRASDPEPEEDVNKSMLEEEEEQCADDAEEADEHENDNEEDYDDEIGEISIIFSYEFASIQMNHFRR